MPIHEALVLIAIVAWLTGFIPGWAALVVFIVTVMYLASRERELDEEH